MKTPTLAVPRLPVLRYLSLLVPSQDGGGTGLTVESAMETVKKGVRHYTTEVMRPGERETGGGIVLSLCTI